MAHDEGWSPTAAVARRVREVRERRGLTAQALADKLVEQGVPWERSTVAKLENGKRQNLTLTEWLALSVVLNVAPVHLLVPPLPSPTWDRPAGERNDPNDDAPFQVTPEMQVPLSLLREFVRGEKPLPGGDKRGFYSEVPPQEFDARQRRIHELLADMGPEGTREQRLADMRQLLEGGSDGPGVD